MRLRREIFEALGGFDEEFFVYLEDLDLSKRIHDAGFKCVYLAQASAYHAGGGSSSNVKAQRLFYSLQSRLIFSRKHYNTFSYAVILLSTLVLEPLIRLARSALRLSWKDIHNTLRAYRMLFHRHFGDPA